MMTVAAVLGMAILSGCTKKEPASMGAVEPAPERGTLAYDKSVWLSLLRDHEKVRREVRHIENGLEAVTESDDPDVAARIIDHAKAMQLRVKHGAQVRVWDPVFAELFENYDKIELSVTETPKGVRIRETSTDPEVVKLLRAHAAGVTDFVEEGSAAAQRETPRSWERPVKTE
jgi:hypothetical protein